MRLLLFSSSSTDQSIFHTTLVIMSYFEVFCIHNDKECYIRQDASALARVMSSQKTLQNQISFNTSNFYIFLQQLPQECTFTDASALSLSFKHRCLFDRHFKQCMSLFSFSQIKLSKLFFNLSYKTGFESISRFFISYQPFFVQKTKKFSVQKYCHFFRITIYVKKKNVHLQKYYNSTKVNIRI